MGLKDKLQFGQKQMLEGAQQLQNYMKSVSESLTNIEKALNHNTTAVGSYLKEVGELVEQIKSDQAKIMEHLGIDDGAAS